jgi:hypothetical protein
MNITPDDDDTIAEMIYGELDKRFTANCNPTNIAIHLAAKLLAHAQLIMLVKGHIKSPLDFEILFHLRMREEWKRINEGIAQ